MEELERALSAALELTRQKNDPTPTAPQDTSVSPASSTQTLQAWTTNHVPDTHSFDAALASFQWHMSYCGLGSALSTSRAAFSSNVYRRTGCTFDLDDFLRETTQSFRTQDFKATRLTTATKWPPQSLVQKCVNYYEESGLYAMFPFADTEALQMLVSADVLNRPQSTRVANVACLIAFTANVTQMHRHDPAFCDAEPDAYAQAALTLVSGLLTEPPDLRTLEAIMMLVSASHGL